MGKYAYEPDSASEQEVAKARGTALAIHFKHTREIMHTIKGMKLSKAKKQTMTPLLRQPGAVA